LTLILKLYLRYFKNLINYLPIEKILLWV
jgi:hypothetical protein